MNIDADQRNADWIKTTAWEYPTDAAGFLMYIGGPDQLDHFMTLPVAEKMPPSLAVELGVRTGKSILLKHLPGQHDQLDHGRRGPSAPEPAAAGVELPRTTEELKAMFFEGTETFYRAIERNGGRPVDEQTRPWTMYRARNIDAAEPEAVTDEQRERIEASAAAWLADPRMQREFSAYGRPPIVAAARLVGLGDAGEDPAESGWVAGQWVNGTIFLYGGVAGDPDAPAQEGFTVGGNDNRTTLTHEYGHQMMSVVGFDENGDTSDFLYDFVDAIEGQSGSETRRNAGQISRYAVTGGPAELFAEAFTLLHQPDFDIEDYTGGARKALEMLQDRIAADIRSARGILEGQEALFE